MMVIQSLSSTVDPEKLYKTFADQVFILHHKEGPDPKDKEQNEWLRPGQVDLNSVPIAWQKALKCALLLVEFKVRLH